MEDCMSHRIPFKFHSFQHLFTLVVGDLWLSQREAERISIVLSCKHSLDVLPSEICTISQPLRPDGAISHASPILLSCLNGQYLVEQIEAVLFQDLLSPLGQLRHSLIFLGGSSIVCTCRGCSQLQEDLAVLLKYHSGILRLTVGDQNVDHLIK